MLNVVFNLFNKIITSALLHFLNGAKSDTRNACLQLNSSCSSLNPRLSNLTELLDSLTMKPLSTGLSSLSC